MSGHGLGPALFMASTRAQVHALVGLTPDPVRVLCALNGFLARDMPPGSFMTLWLGILDPVKRTLSYASAGHNPPLLLRDGQLRHLMRTGPPLAVVPGFAYAAGEPVTLATGDVLVLYTDGVYEAQSPSGELWGEERFEASLTAHAARLPRAQQLADAVLADLGRHVGERRLDDDVTCLVLRVLG